VRLGGCFNHFFDFSGAGLGEGGALLAGFSGEAGGGGACTGGRFPDLLGPVLTVDFSL
jgi:hypothetical protein